MEYVLFNTVRGGPVPAEKKQTSATAMIGRKSEMDNTKVVIECFWQVHLVDVVYSNGEKERAAFMNSADAVSYQNGVKEKDPTAKTHFWLGTVQNIKVDDLAKIAEYQKVPLTQINLQR